MRTTIYLNGQQLQNPDTERAAIVPNAISLINIIQNTKLEHSACFDWCTAQIKYGVAKNHRGIDTRPLDQIMVIETYRHNSIADIRGRCGCAPYTAKECAKSLASGKCVDEFMRETVGAVLYPQFYAKEK